MGSDYQISLSGRWREGFCHLHDLLSLLDEFEFCFSIVTP
jgi:hypothetical protein